MSNPYKKPFAANHKIYEKMREAIEQNREIPIGDIKSQSGESLPRGSISMYVNKITSEQFPGRRFYTRTTNDCLVIGCYQQESSPGSILGKLDD